MGLPYRCNNPERRALLLAQAALNGIDFLEVDPTQTTLYVHFLHPLPGQPGGIPAASALGAAQLRVRGGERVPDPPVTGASTAGRVLTVTVARPGDYSPYVLRLVAGPGSDDPPDGFDPVFSELRFSFKENCPADFDCRVDADCGEPAAPAPALDYLARDYATFRRMLLDRLAVTLPDWRERNPADVGVALVELMAYAADRLAYFQDAAATEAYLGTARLRSSVRRHARLLDYAMHEGAAARAWIVLEVAAQVKLPRGTPVLTAGDPAGPVIRPDQVEAAVARGATVFETLHDAVLLPGRHEIPFYTWGNDDCCLPRGATRAWLRGTPAALGLAQGDVLVFEEVRDPGSGLAADADPAHRHAARLSVPPRPRQDPLTGADVVEVAWHRRDALPFALSLRLLPGGGLASVARGNVVLADHGRTVAGEALPAPRPGRRYRPVLDAPGVAYALAYDPARAPGQPAEAAFDVDPRAAGAQAWVDGAGAHWEPRRDLLASRPSAPDFVVETVGDGYAALRFGDGVHGRRPPAGAALTARYRVGGGTRGNVGADALVRIATPLGDVNAVRNPLAARGGGDPEPLERVRLHAPFAFRVQERAVTPDDWAAAAGRHPEVQRAAATFRWTGSWTTVFVTVDRKGGLPVDADFELRLRAFLERYRLAGYDLEVDGPRFVPLDVAFGVCVKPGYARADVGRALRAELGSGELPGGRRGFFHPDEWSFGEPVYLSRLVSRAMRVPGVDWVDVSPGDARHRFHRQGRLPAGELEEGRIVTGRLEVARLDDDPNAPESGRLELHLRGGS